MSRSDLYGLYNPRNITARKTGQLKSPLDLRATRENTTQEERKDLVHVMIKEVGIDRATTCALWVRARPDYEPLFLILDGLHLDSERRYWIKSKLTGWNIGDIQVDSG